MKTPSDAVVIGGGPCGSFTALNLAKLGGKVTVFEEHDEVGVPSHCPGHLSITGLKKLGLYPLPAKVIENTFFGIIVHSPKGNKFSIRFSTPVTCVVNRARFDKYLAKMAEKAGVQYHLNSKVESLIIKNGFVRGIKVRENGQSHEVFAKIVVDAEGVSSRMLKLAGLPTFRRNMVVSSVQTEVENVKETAPDMVEVFLGKEYAPGFYLWLIPACDGKAKVGLATKIGHSKELLQRFMSKHPVGSKKLGKAKILQTAYHPITLGGPISKPYSNGFLVVGDAASQVKPTTGGGIVFGLTCAKVAAEVAYEALHKNVFTSDFLSTYKKRCTKIFGVDVNIMLKIRSVLDVLSDKNVDDIIRFCTKFSLDKPLQNVKDIDFQGQTLLHTLWNPRILTTLFYIFLSLSLRKS